MEVGRFGAWKERLMLLLINHQRLLIKPISQRETELLISAATPGIKGAA